MRSAPIFIIALIFQANWELGSARLCAIINAKGKGRGNLPARYYLYVLLLNVVVVADCVFALELGSAYSGARET